MGNLNIHITYTLADIQKYLAGKLSASEMHDMEKAALQDPFLADALEGYAQAPLAIAAQHLNQIAASLQQPGKEKIIAPPVTRSAGNTWWKIAAMVIIIAGIGSLTWKIMQPAGISASNSPLAHVEPATKQIQPQPSLQPAVILPEKAADSIKPVPDKRLLRPMPQVALNTSKPKASPIIKEEAKAAAELAATQAKEATGRILQDSSYYQQQVIAANARVAWAKEKREAQANEALAKSAEQKVMITGYAAKAVNTNLLHGTVTDAEGQPVTGASVKVMNGNAVSITDERGKFALKTLDTIARVEITSIGFETMNAIVSVRKNNVVKLESEEESLSDMVVTELHSRKKPAITADKTVADSLHPQGGWQSFQEYVYKKMHQEVDTTGGPQQVSGTIELEFAIDQNGKPRDFKVLKSFDKSFNEKAISALQNGPLWLGDKKKKGRVTVKY